MDPILDETSRTVELGRICTYLATLAVPGYKQRAILAHMNPAGYVSPSAVLSHPRLEMGRHIFIGDRCVFYQAGNIRAREDSGTIILGDKVQIYGDTYFETGKQSRIIVGEGTHIQIRGHLNAHAGATLAIGRRCEIAPNCSFFPYNHGVAPEEIIRTQPVQTKGGITIGDDVWLGVNVTVLDGVHIGQGAVIGAGSVVTRDIPSNAIVFGIPAKVVRFRDGGMSGSSVPKGMPGTPSDGGVT